jgi:hypothetical protein
MQPESPPSFMRSRTINERSVSLAGTSSDAAAQGSSPRARTMRHPFVVGIAGGTASGKTTVCDKIMQRLHDQCVVVSQRAAQRCGPALQQR